MKKLQKRIFITIFIFLCFTNINLFSKNILLTEAIKQNLISISIKGADKKSANYKSGHWGECIEFSITNKTKKQLSITLEPGLFLNSDDTTIQRMMLIDNSMFILAATTTKIKNIYAVCSQMHYRSPSENIAFNIKGKAEGDLLELAKIITKHKIYNYTSQNAVWVLTDNNSIESVYSENKIETEILRNFLAKSKNIKLNKIYSPTKIDRKNTNGNFILKINNNSGGKYTIILYDSLGVEIEVFQKDKEYPISDLVKITYRFESTLLPGIYFVRMTRNENELIHNKAVIVK